ncbi:MAG: TIGR04372 family glycosyltransferase [Dehalococcoidia bacterium]
MIEAANPPQQRSYKEMRFLVDKVRQRGILWCLKRVAPYFLLLPLALLLRLLLLTLKPLIHLRFGRLWSPRLGTFTMVTELYLCERDAKQHPRRSFDLWYHYDRDAYILQNQSTPQQSICNQQLNLMWGRLIHISRVGEFLDRLNRMLRRGSETFAVPLAEPNDFSGLLGQFPAHLSFTESEEQRGLAELENLGITPEDQFVCFHARDSAYLDVARPRNAELYGDWSWQNFRDASIENQIPAAEQLTKLGYFAIRMGKHVKASLPGSNPKVIDYATRHQSDFLDVYLSHRCAFFIGQNSGMTALPMILRKPLVFVNVFPLQEIAYCQYRDGILIPKKFYSQEYGRFLTFREIFDLGLGAFKMNDAGHQALGDQLGLQIVENTAEEILDLAMEMHQRLQSSFQTSEEDRELQERIQALVRSYPQIVPLEGATNRITFGTSFLRANPELLD